MARRLRAVVLVALLPGTLIAQQLPGTNGHVALIYREQIVAGIFALLALITICSLGIVLFSKDPHKVAFAADVLKGIIGFAIGILTTQL